MCQLLVWILRSLHVGTSKPWQYSHMFLTWYRTKKDEAILFTLCWWWLIWSIQNDAKKLEDDWICGELSNEYQHDRALMRFINLGVLVLWTKVALASEGLRCHPFIVQIHALSLFYEPLEWNVVCATSGNLEFRFSSLFLPYCGMNGLPVGWL